MTPDNIQFRSGVVKPLECVKEGWALIKDQYWLFLGIVVVGVLIGSAFPIILIGPMMVGIYLCLFRRMRGEPVEFGNLFKGFDYFAQGLIAALLQMIPMVIVIVPLYLVMFVFMITMMPRGRHVDPDAGATFAFAFLGFYVIFFLVIMLVSVVVHTFFFFTFPLIADRNLSGVDAVRLSFKAARANLGGILGLTLLTAGMGILGVCACYVGALLVMPISFTSYAVAFRRVFPEMSQNFASPPPPPANWAA
jgi:hypothetical protein